MKHLKSLAIFNLLLLSGCIGPKINDCIFDFNIIEKDIMGMQDPITKEAVIEVLKASKPNYCVPPGAKDDSKDFQREMKTGDHNYNATDWGILMRWIAQHKK